MDDEGFLNSTIAYDAHDGLGIKRVLNDGGLRAIPAALRCGVTLGIREQTPFAQLPGLTLGELRRRIGNNTTDGRTDGRTEVCLSAL